LHFPSEILDSPYHNDSDFISFEVPEDENFGDVTHSPHKETLLIS